MDFLPTVQSNGCHAGLVEGSDGNFYGTTYAGGTNHDGTVFKITPQGLLTTLWQFCSVQDQFGDCLDGSSPYAGLVKGSDGNFYGTTQDGGTNDWGTVYKITPQGTLTTLHDFCSRPDCADGWDPSAGLVQGSDGNFYGTTYNGGTNNEGTVFILCVPLSPSANEISAVLLSGTNVIFTIPSVAGETYQLQFSASMTPTNWMNISGAFVSNSIGALLTLTNLGGASQPQGYYRFGITP